MGRPTKLDARVKERLFNALRAGCSIKVAAQYAGIGEATFYVWQQKAQDPQASHVYREFLEELRAVQVETQVAMAAKIRTEDDWRAQAWILERRHPEEWAKTDRHVVSGDPDRPIVLAARRELLESAEADRDRMLPPEEA